MRGSVNVGMPRSRVHYSLVEFLLVVCDSTIYCPVEVLLLDPVNSFLSAFSIDKSHVRARVVTPSPHWHCLQASTNGVGALLVAKASALTELVGA